mmetsp:Transcript_2950/g.11606  ORF Transcript_2950/g.11606 Transcript_2950/m.11606 type:complete len:226 (+) Transcript_2950:601-1278(+)
MRKHRRKRKTGKGSRFTTGVSRESRRSPRGTAAGAGRRSRSTSLPSSGTTTGPPSRSSPRGRRSRASRRAERRAARRATSGVWARGPPLFSPFGTAAWATISNRRRSDGTASYPARRSAGTRWPGTPTISRCTCSTSGTRGEKRRWNAPRKPGWTALNPSGTRVSAATTADRTWTPGTRKSTRSFKLPRGARATGARESSGTAGCSSARRRSESTELVDEFGLIK